MQTMGKTDITLIKRQASALTAAPALKLSEADAQLALAIMWDYESWEELQSAAGQSTLSTAGTATIGPTSLLKTSTELSGEEKAGFIVRQIGRLINSMARFPALSERVGTIVPTLYGYDSIAEIAISNPDTASESTLIPITSDDIIIQSRRNLLPALTGERSGGITLVSGSKADNSTAFVVDATLKLAGNQPIKVIASESHANNLDCPSDSRWKLQAFTSLAVALSNVISYLQHESNTIIIISLHEFSDVAVIEELLTELEESVAIREGNRVILDTGPLNIVPDVAWRRSEYQILLQGALEYYNLSTNHLSLREADVSQIRGFVSRSKEDFSFYLFRDRRDGLLLSALEPSVEKAGQNGCSV